MKVDLSTYIEKNIIQTQILYKFMSYKLMCYIYYCYGILRNNITMLQRFVKSLKLYAILNIVINLPSRENKKKEKKNRGIYIESPRINNATHKYCTQLWHLHLFD